MHERLAFDTEKSVQVVVRSADGNYLAVKAFRNKGWWLPAADLCPGEDFVEAANRVIAELDAKVELKGIIRVSHTILGRIKAKMCVSFFAFSNQMSAFQRPEHAKWVDFEALRRMCVSDEGVAGFELVEWADYIENNGIVMGLRILADEMEYPDSSWQFAVVKEKQLTRPIDLLVSAIRDNNEGAVRRILLNRFNVNCFFNEKMLTALHFACEVQLANIVGLLIFAGADPRIVNEQGKSALHYAAGISVFMLRIVLLGIKDADEKLRALNMPDCHGDTALQIAIKRFGSNDVSSIFL